MRGPRGAQCALGVNHLEGGFAPTTSSPIQGCSGVGPAPAAAFAGTSSAGADGRHRDLLPMPLPPASARNSGAVTRCRAVRRRSERVAHGEFLVTEVVKTLNEMYTGQDGPHTQDAVPPTAAQKSGSVCYTSSCASLWTTTRGPFRRRSPWGAPRAGSLRR